MISERILLQWWSGYRLWRLWSRWWCTPAWRLLDLHKNPDGGNCTFSAINFYNANSEGYRHLLMRKISEAVLRSWLEEHRSQKRVYSESAQMDIQKDAASAAVLAKSTQQHREIKQALCIVCAWHRRRKRLYSDHRRDENIPRCHKNLSGKEEVNWRRVPGSWGGKSSKLVPDTPYKKAEGRKCGNVLK